MSNINQAKVARIIAEAAKITRAWIADDSNWRSGYAIMDGAEDQATDIILKSGRVTQAETQAIYAGLREELAAEIAEQRAAYEAEKARVHAAELPNLRLVGPRGSINSVCVATSALFRDGQRRVWQWVAYDATGSVALVVEMPYTDGNDNAALWACRDIAAFHCRPDTRAYRD